MHNNGSSILYIATKNASNYMTSIRSYRPIRITCFQYSVSRATANNTITVLRYHSITIWSTLHYIYTLRILYRLESYISDVKSHLKMCHKLHLGESVGSFLLQRSILTPKCVEMSLYSSKSHSILCHFLHLEVVLCTLQCIETTLHLGV